MSKPGADRAEPKATMTGVIATIPRIQFSNALGLPLAGGKLTTYLAGTTTPEPTYQDQGLTIKNPTTITLDATGSCVLWLDPEKSYKFLLKSAVGVTQPGWPVDNISGASTIETLTGVFAKFTDLSKPDGADAVGSLSNVMGAVPRTVQVALQDVVSFAMFDSVGDGAEIVKNNKAWEKVEAYVNNFPSSTFAPIGIFIPDGTYKYSRTPTFTRPVRIFSNGGAVLNYVGTDEVIVMGNKAQTSALPGTNDYYEIDNINFIGAEAATYGIYFANWALQPRVSNCRFLNFGGPDMWAITFQGDNWSIDLLDNRYLLTDAAGFARHWCQVLGVSKTEEVGTVTAGQVAKGRHDGGNSRMNALNNWVRFGGDTPGIGYIITGTKSRVIGGGVESPSIGLLVDGTGIPLFNVEISQYFELPYGTAAIQVKGTVSSLNIHDTYANLQNDSFYDSDAKFLACDTATVTSMSIRDITVLSASKHPLVTLQDIPNQFGNTFGGVVQTNAPLLCALGNNYSMDFDGYKPGFHNHDLLGSLDTTVSTIATTPTRVSSRCRVNAGAPLAATVSAVTTAGTGLPPCRTRRFALNWSTVLAAGNFIAIETRMDDLLLYSGGLATGGLVARYLNSNGASSISATLQLVTVIDGISTVIASKAISLTNTAKGYTLSQVVSALKSSPSDFLAFNLIISGAGHAGASSVEIINMDVSTGEFPPPIQPVDSPRQVATANQWWRKISATVSQVGAINWLSVQLNSEWATTVRNIKQITLTGAASATYTPFGESCVYVTPNVPTAALDVEFSVEAED